MHSVPIPRSAPLDPTPILLLAVFVGVILTSTNLPSSVQIAVVAGAMLCTLVVPILHRLDGGGDLSVFLLLPTVLSATQNVYLLLVTGSLDSANLQFLLIVNVLFTLVLLVLLSVTRPQPTREVRDLASRPRRRHAGDVTLRRTALVGLVLTVYGFATMVLFSANTTSALASFRNLATPILFTLVGLLAARRASLGTYLRGLCALAVAVIAFGFFELFTPGFWQAANLSALWDAKGIGTAQATGLPGNFYSSETVDGDQLRRMVSSFADPVNFGTFLFIAFMGAWFLKRPVVMALVVVAASFAVSKGALLGFLIFAILWTRYYTNRVVHVIAIVVTAIVGLLFYGFTQSSSTGSTAAHIGGLLSSFSELPQHPLGRGMGNLGVLAGLFSEGSETGINETGFGMILGQLGIVGLGLFTVLFVTLLGRSRRLPLPRERLFALGTLLGFMSNAAFNEVAMSPNSAGPYFIALGLLLAPVRRGDETASISAQRAKGPNISASLSI
ncbi:hypothetical protein AS850_14155 [Frondihabitans sp. 762G35]|uniref:hypothetical protein n=1 Tax=Frondihabitans sp. 762G35 TaxID=1446794 RepID=UPI000D2220C1|nr:hypothetical protein [Frondihabitans sp. 762G35]ARC58224.1 hypothetical protein AS850_14155 [Frondihabitans sp. 762G35]